MLSCLRKFYPQLSPQLKWGDPSQGKQGRVEAATQQGEAAWLGLPSRLCLALWLAGPRRGSWWPGLSGEPWEPGACQLPNPASNRGCGAGSAG